MFEEWEAWNVRRALKNGAIFPWLLGVPSVAMEAWEAGGVDPSRLAIAAPSLASASAIWSMIFGGTAWTRNNDFGLR